MNTSKLAQLRIDPTRKRRPRATVFLILLVIALVLLSSAAIVWIKRGAEKRVVGSNPYAGTQREGRSGEAPATAGATSAGAGASAPSSAAASSQAAAKGAPSAGMGAAPAAGAVPGRELLLTVSGYIVTRERIELSPRSQGVVQWIGVRKADRVTKGQVVVRLEDAEQRARLAEAEGRLASARVALARAELAERRVSRLHASGVLAEEAADEARLTLEGARALVAEAEGLATLARTYLEWTVIRSPIDGVVLEKLVEPGELVVPMSFGGPRGPSTALLAVADPGDLEVEVDIGEADLSKVAAGGRCRVTPEAYPDRHYDGTVAEIAPEANRQKGTLQVRVRIHAPDRHLTPELSARVDFLRSQP